MQKELKLEQTMDLFTKLNNDGTIAKIDRNQKQRQFTYPIPSTPPTVLVSSVFSARCLGAWFGEHTGGFAWQDVRKRESKNDVE